MTTYLKLLGNQKAKNHLILPSRLDQDAVTLCGATLTQVGNWTRIDRLEGDECPKCAERAFWGDSTIPVAWAKQNVNTPASTAPAPSVRIPLKHSH